MVKTVSNNDIKTIARQLKRQPRGLKSVVSRCGFGCPQVIETEVFLGEGQFFPTLYWLTCPLKVKSVSRLEDEGWSERLQAKMAEDESLSKRLRIAQEDYMARRRMAGKGLGHPVFDTGIGGVRDLDAVKCLHAHYAHYLAGENNPVGEIVHGSIAGFECEERCDRS